jgi:hypothetical protein
MFHMSNDSHLFHARQQLEATGWQLRGNTFHRGDEICFPLYEGKMIWHFDHRLSTYDNMSEEFGDLNLAQHQDSHSLSLTRYWVHESQLPDYAKSGRKAFVSFRKITRSTDARTIVCSIIPVTPCGDSLTVAVINKEVASGMLYVSASLSSLIFDYIARQKLGGVNLNLFALKQLPVLPPATYITTCRWDSADILGDWLLPRVIELTYTARDLVAFAKDCGYDGPPFRWDKERRFLLRCELDAAYFHLYGIERDDVDYIMETFPSLKREDEKQYGEYRTKRVILEIYDEMQRAMESGEAYKTRPVPGPADPAVAHEAKRVEQTF